MENFYSLSQNDLKNWLKISGYHQDHSQLIFRQAYRNLETEPWQATGLPLALPRTAGKAFRCLTPVIDKELISAYDNSVKFALRLEEGQLTEAVLMPESSRITLCVSSQVGCRQACRFCHTGKMGLIRNLNSGEMIGQVMAANAWIQANPWWKTRTGLPESALVTNVVFMGMGEPLDNLTELCRAIEIMLDHHGLALAPRKVTVSTAGHLDGLKVLTEKNYGVGLALSLHETEQAKRNWLMPINRRYPLADVLNLLKEYTQQSGKHILIQYTLISGVNDSRDHARRLAQTLTGIRTRINLIPLNPISANTLSPPDPDSLRSFQQELHEMGLRSMIRFSKGQDITAACGQLAYF